MDKYINEVNERINLISEEIKIKRKELDFEKKIKKIRSNKEKIKKNKIDSRKETITLIEKNKLYETNDLLREENSNMVKIIEPISELESKLYNIKKNILNKINNFDKRKNLMDYKIVKYEKYIKDNNDVLSGKRKEYLDQEIKETNEKIDSLNREMNSLIEDKKPFIYCKKSIESNNKKIFKYNKELTSISKTSSEKIEKSNKIFQYKYDKLITSSKEYEIKIDELLEIIKTIDDLFTVSHISDKTKSFIVEHLDVWYGQKQALFDVNVKFPKNEIIAVIGPSGCGKSTFLRTLNRINDMVPSFRAKGSLLYNGEYDIYKLKSVDNQYDKLELPTLRTKVGMIFQQPNPFPISIEKNVQYGPKIKGQKNKAYLNTLVEESLKAAGLWEEVKDNLKVLGTSLSGGQQQRLCIARTIANEPDVLLMDEPTSALDPIATKKIENLILKLKEKFTIIMVTHSMQQAQRISDKTAFFYQGKLVEYGETRQIFENPKEKETKDYVSGKFG